MEVVIYAPRLSSRGREQLEQGFPHLRLLPFLGADTGDDGDGIVLHNRASQRSIEQHTRLESCKCYEPLVDGIGIACSASSEYLSNPTLMCMRHYSSLHCYFAFFTLCVFGLRAPLEAQPFSPYAYDIGSPSVVDYYIDATNGSDDANGTSTGTAWRTVQHAWNQIPTSSALSQGYRLNLMNGTYGSDELPNYWELKEGTASFPIILRAATGQTSVKFTRDINMANISYFYLIGIEITPAGGGDAFHCESCNHLLIRGCILNGGSTTSGAHETLKVNQSQYVYIENNNILYADDNNIDFVGVQYGHIIGNKIHEASDWCAYVKGGSAYIRVESNEFYNCGTGGFTAGQGSGFQFMTSPWLHYEAYDIKVINNVVHDAEGAAFGVNGGYNVLIAHNTAYRVGSRDHLVEVVFGERTCDGTSNGQADATCAANRTAGGWGPATVRTTPEPIGNRNVFILNNIFYNPSGVSAPQHFAIYGPRTPSNDVNLTSPQRSDTNLVISGNLIWNGNGSTLFGVEDTEQGCQSGNPTCTLAQLQADNVVNTTEPQLRDPEADDLRPQTGAALLSQSVATLTSFSGGDRPSPPTVTEGVLENSFTRDFSGAAAIGTRVVGAFTSPDSALTPPAIDGSDVPGLPAISAPTLSGMKITAKKSGKKTAITVSVRVASDEEPESVSAVITQKTRTLGTLTLSNVESTLYRGSAKYRTTARQKIKAALTATNRGGSSSAEKSVKAP